MPEVDPIEPRAATEPKELGIPDALALPKELPAEMGKEFLSKIKSLPELEAMAQANTRAHFALRRDLAQAIAISDLRATTITTKKLEELDQRKMLLIGRRNALLREKSKADQQEMADRIAALDTVSQVNKLRREVINHLLSFASEVDKAFQQASRDNSRLKAARLMQMKRQTAVALKLIDQETKPLTEDEE